MKVKKNNNNLSHNKDYNYIEDIVSSIMWKKRLEFKFVFHGAYGLKGIELSHP
jgi:hypothetical protein